MQVNDTLPSGADLDADAAEKAAAAATIGSATVTQDTISREEFQNEIMEIHATNERLNSIAATLLVALETITADIEAFQNRIAAFNLRSTHKL